MLQGFRSRLPAVLLAIMVVPAAMADSHARIVMDGRHFVPQSLTLPAGKKVRLTVHNHARLPAEFESYDLSREVVVPPGGTVHIYVGPLKPGKYHFFNDFNPAARGWIVVDDAKQESQP